MFSIFSLKAFFSVCCISIRSVARASYLVPCNCARREHNVSTTVLYTRYPLRARSRISSTTAVTCGISSTIEMTGGGSATSLIEMGENLKGTWCTTRLWRHCALFGHSCRGPSMRPLPLT
uniref:Putative secreted protein n=1 Tax=Ixodes ricinus TaxID=34613 RepID=A0A6B0UN11_IXORI